MKTNLNAASITILLLAVGMIGLSIIGSMSLTSCASTFANQSFTYTPTGSATPITIIGFGAWCENNLSTIRSSTKFSVTTTAAVLSKNNQAKVAQISANVKATENVLQPLLNQTSVSEADLDASLAKVNVNDPSGIFASIIAPGITLAGGYLVELKNEGAPAKVTIDVVTAVVNGLNDAYLILNPPISLHLNSNHDLRPPYGSRKIASAYDLSLTKD